jgi:hypothetical protein
MKVALLEVLFTFVISRSVLLRMKNAPDKLEKIKTHILFSILFFPKNRAVYDVMWKLLYSRTGNVTRRMRFACWIPKATNTNSEYILLFHCNNGCMNAP